MNEIQLTRREQKLIVWSQRIDECSRSGLSKAQWCRENHYSQANFYLWQKRVREAKLETIPKDEPPALVDITQAMNKGTCYSIVPVMVRKGEIEIALFNNADCELVKTIMASL